MDDDPMLSQLYWADLAVGVALLVLLAVITW